MTKVVVATIVCDFKAYSLGGVLKRNAELDGEKLLYVNIETLSRREAVMHYDNLLEGVAYDIWTWDSSWRGQRGYDQDQGYRLPAIVQARNMAREYALRVNADAILYVDSDVLVPKGSIPRLLDTGQNIVGGVVPGRGAHEHTVYMGGGKHRVNVSDGVVELDYATAGFVLIRRPVYRAISWRWGYTHEGGGPISEDPLFAYDARKAGFGWWYVCTDLRARHVDDTARPLEEKGTADF